MPQVQLYDTTLRDGAQREGISFSVEDKLKIAQKLDELGIHFIEGGWPGSNPKDVEFFAKARGLSLSHAVLAAFGSTRRPHTKVETDPNLKALTHAGTKVVTLVGKSWNLHVTQVLETSLDENLAMIRDSIRYLKSKGHMVFFDAEHFFDGYEADAEYALHTIKAAAEAGADCVVLCDTNGGGLPDKVAEAVNAARSCHVPLGIHAHNDAELAVANTLVAVQAGATQIQGTINGYGERCGNANLCSVIPALKLKMGIDCVTDEQLAKLTDVAHYVTEVANLTPDTHLPYVGASAFTHKAGLHVSGIMKVEDSYQHIDPKAVGNQKGVVVSELSGKSNVIYLAQELGLDLAPESEEAHAVLEQIKELESHGFQYDVAEASFELLVRKAQPNYQPPFEVIDFRVVVEPGYSPISMGKTTRLLSGARIRVNIGGEIYHGKGVGVGPVDALDKALRALLHRFYPGLKSVQLLDYKVRIVEGSRGTEAVTRVLMESSDGKHTWRTVGSSPNIIEASLQALADSLEYWLLRWKREEHTAKSARSAKSRGG